MGRDIEESKELTALVKVNPEVDVQVIGYYNEALGLQNWAEAMVIATADYLKPATDDLSVIAKLKKVMEERRKTYLQPFQEHIKEVNEAYRRFMEPVEKADQITRKKILAFQAEQAHIRQEQNEINRLKMEVAKMEVKLKGGPTEPVDLVEILPEAPKKTITEMGTTSTFKVKKWEVVDFALVPNDLKIIDASKVTKLVKAGVGSIAGIRIYEEDSLRVSIR